MGAEPPGGGLPQITYGALCAASDEGLNATLRTAKKQRVVAYDAEVLFKGKSAVACI